jgi:hypothetical protein
MAKVVHQAEINELVNHHENILALKTSGYNVAMVSWTADREIKLFKKGTHTASHQQ